MARSVEVKILGDASSLQRAFRTAGSAGDSFGKRHPALSRGLKGVGLAAAGVAGIVGGGLALAFKQGVESLKAHELADAQTAAAIKSTGSAAKVSAQEIRDHANALEDLTGMDDVAIQKGQNLLLTFTNIRNEAGAGNDIFSQTTGIMLDMATAMGTDTTTAAMTLGKALQDPEAGMSRLTRAGVTFTDGQKAAITAMVEAGDTMGAQKLILEELRKEFGGSAAAAGDTFAGKINKLKNKFEELGEKLASKVMPYAERFIEWITDLMDSDPGEILGKIGDAISTLGSEISKVMGKVDWGKLASDLGTGLSRAFAAVNWGKVVKGIGDVLYNLMVSVSVSLFEPVYRATDEAIAWVAERLAGMVSAISDVIEALGAMPGGKNLFGGTIEALEGAESALNSYAGSLRSKWATIDRTRKKEKELDAALTDVSETTSEASRNWSILMAVYKGGGLPALARSLTGVSNKLSVAQAATLAWAEAFGEVPTEAQVEAILEDDEAVAALKDWVDDINSTPSTVETKAKALGTAQAKSLLDTVTAAAKRIPERRNTAAATSGTRAAKDALDSVATAGKNIPTNRSTKTKTANTGPTVAELNRVRDAANNIPRSVTVTVNGQVLGNFPGLSGGATGVRNWRGGMLMVGENGPEIVSLPAGSDVYSNTQSRTMLGHGGGGGGVGAGPTVIVNVQGSVMAAKDLAETVRDELLKLGRRNLTTGLT